jgi:hypothetical protein
MPITGLKPLKSKLCDAAKIYIFLARPVQNTRDKYGVLSKMPFTLLAISQAPEGFFDRTLCQNLALDKTRQSRFNGNIM